LLTVKSLGYDESDPRDDTTIAHNDVQVVATIKASKSVVSKPGVAFAFFLVPCLMLPRAFFLVQSNLKGHMN